MKKKTIIYIVVGIILVAGIFYLSEIAGSLIGALLVAVGLRKSKADKAKENIEQAGEGYEAKEHDAESAAEKLDKIVGDQDEKD